MLKNTIAVVFLFGSILLASLIIFDKKPEFVLENTLVSEKTVKNLAEDLPSTNINSTQEIAKTIVQELAAGKTEGPATPEEMVNNFLAEKIANFDYESFVQEIDEKKIKIVRSGDKKLAESYFRNLNVILENNFGKSSVEDFDQLALLYQKAIAQLYSLNVPESIADLHRREIAIFATQQKIFEAFADYESDPMKALLAAELAKESYKELSLLRKEMSDFVKNNGLNI